MTSLSPRTGLETAAAIQEPAGKSAAKLQRQKSSALDTGFPEVFGDVVQGDDDSDAQSEAVIAVRPDTDPITWLQIAPLSLPIELPQQSPRSAAFGIEQVAPDDAMSGSETGFDPAMTPAQPAMPIALTSQAASITTKSVAFAVVEDSPLQMTQSLEPPAPPLGTADTLETEPRIITAITEETAATPEPIRIARQAPEPAHRPMDLPGAVPVTALPSIPGSTPAEPSEESNTENESTALEITDPPPDSSPSARAHAAEHKSETGKVVFEAKLTPHVMEPPSDGELQRGPNRLEIAANNQEGERKHDRNDAEQTAPAIPATQPEANGANAGAMPAAQGAAEPARAEAPAPAVHSEAPRAAPEPVADPALANASPARDIRVEVSGGENRVQLRLTERGGEVHVSVRTPDSHMAGQLRENLPALTSRLESAGFRTEAWHPTERLERTVEAGIRNSRAESGAGEDANRRDREKQPQQQGQEQSRPQTSKQKGKQFAWLISSLR